MTSTERETRAVIVSLGEAAVAAQYLAVHLRLLKATLERFDPKLRVSAEGLHDLADGVCVNPTPDGCGPRPPWQPILDACNGVIRFGEPEWISMSELANLAGHAEEWCRALLKELGNPHRPPIPPRARED